MLICVNVSGQAATETTHSSFMDVSNSNTRDLVFFFLPSLNLYKQLILVFLKQEGDQLHMLLLSVMMSIRELNWTLMTSS